MSKDTCVTHSMCVEVFNRRCFACKVSTVSNMQSGMVRPSGMVRQSGMVRAFGVCGASAFGTSHRQPPEGYAAVPELGSHAKKKLAGRITPFSAPNA